jgi:hypothetical protein
MVKWKNSQDTLRQLPALKNINNMDLSKRGHTSKYKTLKY